MASQLRVTDLPSVARVSPLLLSSRMFGGTASGIKITITILTSSKEEALMPRFSFYIGHVIMSLSRQPDFRLSPTLSIVKRGEGEESSNQIISG